MFCIYKNFCIFKLYLSYFYPIHIPEITIFLLIYNMSKLSCPFSYNYYTRNSGLDFSSRYIVTKVASTSDLHVSDQNLLYILVYIRWFNLNPAKAIYFPAYNLLQWIPSWYLFMSFFFFICMCYRKSLLDNIN